MVGWYQFQIIIIIIIQEVATHVEYQYQIIIIIIIQEVVTQVEFLIRPGSSAGVSTKSLSLFLSRK